MRDITITITGVRGSGKTTLQLLIGFHLKGHAGISVALKDEGRPLSKVPEKEWKSDRCCVGLSEPMSVCIDTHTPR